MTTNFQAITLTLNPAVDCTVTIPNFTPGAVNRVGDLRQQPGGKGVNVALALAGLGHRVAATGFLGEDNSKVFEDRLTSRGVAQRFIRIPGATRTSIKVVDPVSRQTTDINFPGLTPTEAQQRLLDGGVEQLQAPWFALCGSVPEGMDAAIYQQWITALKQRGIKVVLDTSGEPLRRALPSLPDIIKPNLHELSDLVGSALNTREEVLNAATALVQRGVELVVVSLGADGALFVTRDEVLTAKPPAIKVHSTVGAGDAMVAGILAGALRGLSLADQARLATASSLQVLASNGPDREINENAPERWLPTVMIT